MKLSQILILAPFVLGAATASGEVLIGKGKDAKASADSIEISFINPRVSLKERTKKGKKGGDSFRPVILKDKGHFCDQAVAYEASVADVESKTVSNGSVAEFKRDNGKEYWKENNVHGNEDQITKITCRLATNRIQPGRDLTLNDHGKVYSRYSVEGKRIVISNPRIKTKKTKLSVGIAAKSAGALCKLMGFSDYPESVVEGSESSDLMVSSDGKKFKQPKSGSEPLASIESVTCNY